MCTAGWCGRRRRGAMLTAVDDTATLRAAGCRHGGAGRRLPRRGRRARGGRAARGRPAARRRQSGSRGRPYPTRTTCRGFLTEAPADTTTIAGPTRTTRRSRRQSAYLPSSVHRARVDRAVHARSRWHATAALRDLVAQPGRLQPAHGNRARAGTAPGRQSWCSHVEGAGCYGHNGADDAAMDAALLALAVPGRPVQVVWIARRRTRRGPRSDSAGVVRVSAETATDGRCCPGGTRSGAAASSAAPASTAPAGISRAPATATARRSDVAHRAAGGRGGGTRRNAVPGYDFPSYEVVNHLTAGDAVAHVGAALAGRLPQRLRSRVVHGRARRSRGRRPRRVSAGPSVATRAAVPCWKPPHARSNWGHTTASDSVGHGIGYARYKNTSAYCAVIAEVEAVEQVRVRRLTIAVDAGLVISPDGASNQIEGGAIQATSWTIKERVRFDRYGVTSDNWESYPILRFSEVPGRGRRTACPATDTRRSASGRPRRGRPRRPPSATRVYDAIGVRVQDPAAVSEEQIVAAMQ